jgi:hypothetical protein
VLNHDWLDSDDDLGGDYRQACTAWYSALTSTDRSVAGRVLEVCSNGNEATARYLASGLPPAPVFPLS